MARVFDSSLTAMHVQPTPESELLILRGSLDLAWAGNASATMSSAAPRRTPTAQPKSIQPLSPPSPTESRVPARRFEDLNSAELAAAVWSVLIGYGAAPWEQLVRVAAHGLKARGQLSFERLREGGLVYRRVKKALERGVRIGTFDKPSRGARRAIAESVAEIPRPAVESLIRQAVSEGLPEVDAVSLLANKVCQLCGTSDLASAQRIVGDAMSAMKARGDIAVADGDIIPTSAST